MQVSFRASMAVGVGATFLVVAASVVSASAAGVATAPKTPRILLYVPAPGHVTLEAVRIQVTGRGAGRFTLPRRFRLVDPSTAPGAVAMVAVRRQVSRSSATLTLLAVVVNGVPRKLGRDLQRTSAGSTPFPVLLAGSFGPGVSATIALVLPKLQAAREVTARERCSSNIQRLVLTCRAYHEVFVNADEGKPGQFRAWKSGIPALDLPTNGLFPGPGWQSSIYDDSAPGGRGSGATGVEKGLTIPDVDPKTLPDLVPDFYDDAGVGLPPPQSPLETFGFSGLHLSWSDAAQNVSGTFSLSGKACGTDPATALWTLTRTDVDTSTIQLDFADANPAQGVGRQSVAVNGTTTLTIFEDLALSPAGTAVTLSDRVQGADAGSTTVTLDTPTASVAATPLPRGSVCAA